MVRHIRRGTSSSAETAVLSDLRILGQIGTTIGLGLLFDTLIVRSFMTPSIAALLGRRFWTAEATGPEAGDSVAGDTPG